MVSLIAMWMTLQKADKPGWSVLIPIYNMIVQSEVVWGNGAKIFLSLIPIYNLYFIFKHQIAFAHAFGKTTGYGVAMVFLPIMIWFIGFDSAVTYQGPQA